MSPHPRSQSLRWVTRATRLEPPPAAPQLKPASPQISLPMLATPAAHTADAAAELWVALHLTDLPLVAAQPRVGNAAQPRVGNAAQPRVVIEREGRVQRVLCACPLAQARGIHPGMTLAAALLAAPKLTATVRDARRERSLLESLALVGFGFTSRVSLEPPDAVLLEVKGSLRLFAGAQALLQQLQAQCRAQGLAPLLALAPTPLAALALARAQLLAHKATQKSRSIPMLTDTAHFVGALAALPLTVLRWPAELLERLASLGVRSIGEVLRLPRAGFAKRFGASHRLALDRLVARAPDARTAFIPRQRFAARCEPAYELAEQANIVRACEPLLAQLEQFLRQRQCGVTTLCVWLRHRAPPAALRCEAVSTRLVVRFAAPELAAARFTSLLAERLAQTALPAPVVHLELRCGPLQPFAPGSDSLWRPGEHGGAAGREAPAFIERLRARLGNEAVYGLCLVPAHRPEAAWAVAEPQPAARALAVSSVQSTHLGRPLWLLRTPVALDITADALDAAGFTLLAGPERIETGWWDGNDVRRDYYLVRDAMGAELWLFRERSAPHRWFLQGVFA